MHMELTNLTTEQRNQNSMNLDRSSTYEILTIINDEDKKVADAVKAVLPQVETAVDQIASALGQGGRLFYVGAGTSGRLGVVDASECPPTFMTSKEMVQTVMAGGNAAFFQAAEGTEDDEAQGREDLKARGISEKDVVIGITASGRTPYPIGALKCARELGAYTVSLTCNKDSKISEIADCRIEVVVGPEVLTGSTRMKAATSHKMILNMISTATMIKLGKVYENLMIDVHASNYKLKERAKQNIMEITNVSYDIAENVLNETNHKVKPAIVMIKAGVSLEEANKALGKSSGFVRDAIDSLL
ncbi:N-acetylmuramic acid 6-phosphate etherase [Oceanobacillus massiliensis]|uniref:N-acetylmuramic acid 6-phosphate etherase n=1 Tax=Oceanobacillus massiliensis TaxID=1465765 RepID=UPI0030192392